MMTETRRQYAEHIAEVIRYALKESGVKKLPEKSIIVAKLYSPLCDFDEILGIPIYVMDMPSSFEFFIAYPSVENQNMGRFQKYFEEGLDLFDIERR